jgi:hypothetical protein
MKIGETVIQRPKRFLMHSVWQNTKLADNRAVGVINPDYNITVSIQLNQRNSMVSHLFTSLHFFEVQGHELLKWKMIFYLTGEKISAGLIANQ